MFVPAPTQFVVIPQILSLTTNTVSHCESVYTSAVDRVTAATALDDRPEVIPKARSGEWRYYKVTRCTDEERSERCTTGSKLAALAW